MYKSMVRSNIEYVPSILDASLGRLDATYGALDTITNSGALEMYTRAVRVAAH